MNGWRFLTLLVVALGSPVFASPTDGVAGDPASVSSETGDQSSKLDDIIVTARRREERVQDVPISITALNNAQLQQFQVIDVVSLANVTPGMTANQSLGPTEITIAIRGLTNVTPSLNSDPAIGQYVDGVYNALTTGANTSMIDLDRVEVLKGPQGTLFGRNTIGGAMSITTNKPTDKFEGYVEGDWGNYDAQTYTGVLNLPIVPGKLDTRLVYHFDEHQGYGENETLGTQNGTLHQNYVRESIKAEPADDWEVTLTASYDREYGNNVANKLGYLDPTTSIVNTYPSLFGMPNVLISDYVLKGGWQDSYENQLDTFFLAQSSFTSTITGKLSDAVTVKSITGYTKTANAFTSDADASPYTILQLPAYATDANQTSEELQLYGDALESRLKWLTGVYYYIESGTQLVSAVILPAFSPPPEVEETMGSDPNHNKSYSSFAQLTYELTPGLRLTGGVRYTKDIREVTYHDNVNVVATDAYVSCALANTPTASTIDGCGYSASVGYHYIPWTVGIDYEPNKNSLVYAKVSQGYRSGAFQLQGPAATGNPVQNAAAVAAFLPVAPESLLSPEIGAKMDFLDHKFRINGAAFYSDYKNVQTSTILPPPCSTCSILAQLQNSGGARVYGGELELEALLGGLRLNGGAGVAVPKYILGPSEGMPFVKVSKVNASVGASYPIQMQSGVLTLNSDYTWRSKMFLYGLSAGGFSPTAADAINAAVTQPAFGTLQARITFDLTSAPITFALYGQNLTNVDYKVSAEDFGPPLSWANFFVGPPRTFGGSVKYRF